MEHPFFFVPSHVLNFYLVVVSTHGYYDSFVVFQPLQWMGYNTERVMLGLLGVPYAGPTVPLAGLCPLVAPALIALMIASSLRP